MADFNVQAARNAGYSDDEILSHLTQTRKFDVDGAVKSGYSKGDIISHLSSAPATLTGSDATPKSAQGILNYTNETLSNIPSSAGRLAKGIGQALLHPINTAGTVVKTAAELGQKMTPGWKNPTPNADAAIQGVKDRYGSLDAIANTVKTDPVGVASDASLVAGGVSGLARGAAGVANVAGLSRTAGAAAKVADVAGTVSDVVNPLALPTKIIGGTAKALAKPLVKSALRLPGKTERYGATPATAALEETKGITPTAVKASATQRLADLHSELEALATAARASGNTGDLTAARQVVADEIAKVQSANGVADDLLPMQRQLTEARPGFGGSVTPAGDVAAHQDPLTFLGMKHQFGDDFTKFDAAVPLKDSTRKVGNKAYHELSSEFNRTVPGAQPINQKMQSLVPVKEGAQRAEEGAGAVQRAIDRSTRPTGGLAAALFALHQKGIFGAAAVMAAQEMLSSPTAKMAGARTLYKGGTGLSAPLTRRIGNTAAEAGKFADDQEIPKFARGGIIRKKTLGLVGEAGPELIMPVEKLQRTSEGRATLRSLPTPDAVERTSSKLTVPEKPESLKSQLNQLASGKRRLVMFPKSTPLMKRPKGMHSYTDLDKNTYLFNPELTSQKEIDRAVHGNTLTELLGPTDGGMGVPDKSVMNADLNVIAKEKNGTPVQSAASDRKFLKRAIKQAKKITPKGGKVYVESPDKEITRRQSA